jgi:hypothetical protein
MKRIALAVVLAVFAFAPAALAAGTLTGTYKTTVKHSKFGAALDGTWKLKLATGHYKALHNGKLAVKGIDTTVAHVITLTDTGGPDKCKGTGKYKYRLHGKKLTFTKISDSKACAGRSALLKYTFKKVG